MTEPPFATYRQKRASPYLASIGLILAALTLVVIQLTAKQRAGTILCLSSSYRDDNGIVGEKPEVSLLPLRLGKDYPQQCTDLQMNLVKERFPPGRANLGMNTQCPHATWFDRHLYDTHTVARANGQTGSMTFLGITFGCNKGDDAVQTLAKFTGNPDISAEKWRRSYSTFAVESGSALTGRACPETPPTWIDDRHPLRHDGIDLPICTNVLCRGCGEDSKYT